MEVYLLRHGEAGDRIPVAKDSERALTASGKDEVQKIGESLADQGYVFDEVVSSPLKRARDTAEIVNKALKRKGKVEEWNELKPEGSRVEFYRRLSKLKPTAAVLCVGHEPYLTSTVVEVIGMAERPAGSRIVLRKGGMAKLVITRFTPRVTGELRWLLTPKQLKRLA